MLIQMKKRCIIKYFEDGYTMRDIGKLCGCSHSTVIRFLQKNYPKDKYNEINKNKLNIKNNKYNLWDNKICRYVTQLYGKKSFCYFYKNEYVPIGYFHEFISIEIINDIVEENL